MSIKSNQAQFDKFIIKKDEINIPSRSNDSNNLLEFYLEKNEINIKFLELSKKDKNHVIEIGLINMTTFNNKTVSAKYKFFYNESFVSLGKLEEETRSLTAYNIEKTVIFKKQMGGGKNRRFNDSEIQMGSNIQGFKDSNVQMGGNI